MRISDWSSDVCSADLAGGTDDAVDVDAERAMAIVPFAHRRAVPGDQHLRRPAVGVVAGRVSPVAVPVLVELALVGDHGVVYAVGRTDGQVVAGAAVASEVDSSRARRVGTVCVSECRSRGAPYHYK